MRHSHTEIWTHLVISTLGYKPYFTAEWKQIIIEAIENYLEMIPDHQGNYHILPDHIHFLIKLPDNMALCALVDQIKTHISNHLKLKYKEAENFQWEKKYHAHSVSLNRLSTEKNIIERQEIKHKEMTLEEELKFFGM
jgi:putative transposase